METCPHCSPCAVQQKSTSMRNGTNIASQQKYQHMPTKVATVVKVRRAGGRVDIGIKEVKIAQLTSVAAKCVLVISYCRKHPSRHDGLLTTVCRNHMCRTQMAQPYAATQCHNPVPQPHATPIQQPSATMLSKGGGGAYRKLLQLASTGDKRCCHTRTQS